MAQRLVSPVVQALFIFHLLHLGCNHSAIDSLSHWKCHLGAEKPSWQICFWNRCIFAKHFIFDKNIFWQRKFHSNFFSPTSSNNNLDFQDQDGESCLDSALLMEVRLDNDHYPHGNDLCEWKLWYPMEIIYPMEIQGISMGLFSALPQFPTVYPQTISCRLLCGIQSRARNGTQLMSSSSSSQLLFPALSQLFHT